MFIRVHPKALIKAKNKLRALMKRNRGVNGRKMMKEAEHGAMGRMAAAQNSGEHLETVKEVENQTKEPDKAGYTGIICKTAANSRRG